tara:strand:+ start:206 stop:373 length:168 start_codon:yes stop_codon:yes gene_type:complete
MSLKEIIQSEDLSTRRKLEEIKEIMPSFKVSATYSQKSHLEGINKALEWENYKNA